MLPVCRAGSVFTDSVGRHSKRQAMQDSSHKVRHTTLQLPAPFAIVSDACSQQQFCGCLYWQWCGVPLLLDEGCVLAAAPAHSSRLLNE